MAVVWPAWPGAWRPTAARSPEHATVGPGLCSGDLPLEQGLGHRAQGMGYGYKTWPEHLGKSTSKRIRVHLNWRQAPQTHDIGVEMVFYQLPSVYPCQENNTVLTYLVPYYNLIVGFCLVELILLESLLLPSSSVSVCVIESLQHKASGAKKYETFEVCY